MGIDIIGDVHGHAEPLKQLLSRLGYRNTRGAWRHPCRTALFIGDLIDRGPRQLETIDIARRMRDAGSAVIIMGNHEFNAIAYATESPDKAGEHYRPRHGKNEIQHRAFLAEVGCADTPNHRELIDLFKTFPLWIEYSGFCAVHACWKADQISALDPLTDQSNCLTESGFHAAQQRGSSAWIATETVLKGPDMILPSGIHFLDADGNQRNSARLRWWDMSATTWSAACNENNLSGEIPDTPLPDNFFQGFGSTKPVLFGHYWFAGIPQIVGPRLACVDFSIAKGGVLAAYRHDGETGLRNENFWWCPA